MDSILGIGTPDLLLILLPAGIFLGPERSQPLRAGHNVLRETRSTVERTVQNPLKGVAKTAPDSATPREAGRPEPAPPPPPRSK